RIINEFEDVRMIGKGCFSTVYLARWKRSDFVKYYQYVSFDSNFVVLKELYEADLNEIKMHSEIGVGNPSFMKYFRIARIENENHFFVLKYAYM
ncbi:5557_t:CDS:2, partial [Gigaspora rosea]